jgi:hypothetical protein
MFERVIAKRVFGDENYIFQHLALEDDVNHHTALRNKPRLLTEPNTEVINACSYPPLIPYSRVTCGV